ncbi:SusC/RagA family TonB-linked outer membrane protein [uncultured Mucilaginibacter sp.]|uniref:SusC/RagA family TonB-linked outer membrane protein n=1 Tax=uncultured Mucilaginibacter sp. TaxID=797541 RepID=UPI0025EC6F7F|nr:SusC/RagA family TonB-linked outer membrane protein [uncultured Mucilaginibacter sp.]
MKKVYLFKYGLTILLLICAFSVFAQKSTFAGKVVDETAQPLPGATVRVKGTDKSTTTDLNGKFTLPGSDQSAIVVTITYIGYDTMEKVMTANEPVTIQLIPNQKALSEVVVVGYGTVKKTDLTGSVSNLGSKDLNPGAVTSPLQELEGKAAGVNINQVGSEPGVAPSIRIRGFTSLQGGNDPLVVVDGIQGNMDLLQQVPPSEIASVDILKDASATAIYGSRGAPGVIIITTKKTSAGKTSVEYNENTSLDVISKKLQLLNAASWTQEANALGVDASANHGSNTDWYDLLTQNGVTENHSLSFGGGSNEFNYRASLTAINETGLVIGTGYKNYIGRVTATQKALDDKLTLTMNINSGINEAVYEPNGVGNAAFHSNLISQAYIARPTDPVFDTDGSYYRDPNVFQYTNPYAVAKTVKNDVNSNELFGSLRADLDIYKGLSAGWFGSWRKVDGNTGFYEPSSSTIQYAIDNNGVGNINNWHNDEKLMDINLSYKHDFDKKNHFDATLVYEWQAQTYNGDFAQGRGFVNDLASYNALQLGDISKVLQGDISSYKNDRRLVSFLGRVNYSFDSKYLLTASIRRDGSTVFGVNNKWGNFPSAAFAWRITQEDFMKDQHLFSNLKLRVGYGITGNQQGIGPQNSIALVGQAGTVFFGGQTIPNYAATQNANPNLKWETKKQANAGLDFSMFNDRLNGTVDVYTSNTDNLLFNYTVPLEGPFLTTNILANVGSLQNRGLELTLSYRVIQSKNTTLTLAGNASFMSNKVLSLGGNIEGYNIPTNYVGLSTPNSYLVVGKPIGTFLILKHSGVNAQGVETVVGEDASGNVDQAPQSKYRVDEGQALPKYEFGFTPSFTYKNFDVSMVWSGAGGNKIYNGISQDFSMLENIGKQNLLTSAMATGIHSSPFGSDEWLEDGSYIRFQNLMFGYKVNLTNVKFISALRISLTGQNLAIITKYKGLDPQLNTSDLGAGYDYGVYPRTRTFSVGLNVILK